MARHRFAAGPVPLRAKRPGCLGHAANPAGRRPPAAGYEVCSNQADASATGEPEPIGGPA